MANTSTNLTAIDFDTLKASFIAYMRSQDEFKDYDYASSNMNVLIDLLTYNSHLNAFYTNMQLSESFLDSAQLKSSVISHAKELNYTPRSAHSAQANINISFTGPASSYLLQKGQTFTATIKSNTYTFSLADNLLMTSPNGYFSANVSLYEGVYLFDTYVINSADPTQRLVINNLNVDMDSLSVVVYEDNNVIGTPYSKATTLLGLRSTNKVFFTQQAENEQYEVLFGDGVVGYRPKDGSTVILNYRITAGSDGNGAKLFTINFNPGPTNDAAQINVQTITVSSAGANAEDVDSVRYFAPKHFQVQERSVGETDYSIMLRTQFPEIDAVSVYGGETLNPPQFNTVVIAVNIENVDGLPDSKVQAYKQFLSDRRPLSTRIIFVKPLYSYLAVRSVVNYNINQTALNPENMKVLVTNTIQEYAANNLGTFSNKFRYSKFCSLIDRTDESIVGNETDVLIYKKITPQIGVVQNIDVDFALPLQVGVVQPLNVADVNFHSVYSGPFLINGIASRFEDDGQGNLYIVNSQLGRDVFVNKIGTVNYDTGLVKIVSFNVSGYDGNSIKIYARAREKDVVENQATILDIEPDEIQVTVNTVRE